MKETLQQFWGDDVEISDDAALTWMRQPHYYMGLYSYTYSAGLTVATQVCKRIEAEGQTAVDDWKKVLTAGSTKTPEELAKMAGVDISTDAPLLDTIETIGSIIDEICELTEVQYAGILLSLALVSAYAPALLLITATSSVLVIVPSLTASIIA